MFEKTTLADLGSILTASVVRFNNLPVIISNLNGPEDVPIQAYYLSTGDPFLSHWDDPMWDFEPVPLGYVNSFEHKRCCYLGRGVSRQYKVGLTTENSVIAPCDGRENDLGLRIRRDISAQRKNTPLSNTILGIYPSKEDAFNLIDNNEMISVGISREFAINKDFHLSFRGMVVGVISENGDPFFSRNKDYLKMFWEKV